MKCKNGKNRIYQVKTEKGNLPKVKLELRKICPLTNPHIPLSYIHFKK